MVILAPVPSRLIPFGKWKQSALPKQAIHPCRITVAPEAQVATQGEILQ